MARRFLTLSVTIALVLCGGLSAAADLPKPIRVILVGDSTMASGSGYGDALCARFVAEAKCINLARGGRSTSTFRKEQRWAEVETLLRGGDAFSATYVVIQFGHNDQPGKGERSTDLVTGFGPNMSRYASETKALGGVPVLVSPLARRTFKGPYLKDTLGPWAEATRGRFDFIQHAMIHSTYHRGQLITIGRHLGYVDAPMTDYNFYLTFAY